MSSNTVNEMHEECPSQAMSDNVYSSSYPVKKTRVAFPYKVSIERGVGVSSPMVLPAHKWHKLSLIVLLHLVTQDIYKLLVFVLLGLISPWYYILQHECMCHPLVIVLVQVYWNHNHRIWFRIEWRWNRFNHHMEKWHLKGKKKYAEIQNDLNKIWEEDMAMGNFYRSESDSVHLYYYVHQEYCTYSSTIMHYMATFSKIVQQKDLLRPCSEGNHVYQQEAHLPYVYDFMMLQQLPLDLDLLDKLQKDIQLGSSIRRHWHLDSMEVT